MKKLLLSSMLVTFILSSCVPAMAQKGIAIIQGTEEGSKAQGIIALEDTKEGLVVNARLSNFPPGEHGFHIHQYGSCSEGGKAAGGHYNPKGTEHGLLSKDGVKKAHAGDLGNITIDKNGDGELDITLSELTLTNSDFTVSGRAFIVHAKADDFGQPTGNAGARIGCGSIILVKK